MRRHNQRCSVAFGLRLLYRAILFSPVILLIWFFTPYTPELKGLGVLLSLAAVFIAIKWQGVRLFVQLCSIFVAVLYTIFVISDNLGDPPPLWGPLAVVFGPYILARACEFIEWPHNHLSESCEDILPQGLPLRKNNRYRLKVEHADRPPAHEAPPRPSPLAHRVSEAV